MPSRAVCLGFAIILMVAGLIGLIVGLIFHRQDSYLAAHGTHVTATVLAAREHRVRNRTFGSSSSRRHDDVSWSLLVDYPVGQGRQRADLYCTLMAYLSHKAGETVEVIYDPQDPKTAQLGGNMNDRSSWLVMILSGLGLLLGTALLIVVTRSKPADPDIDSYDP